MQLYRLTSGLHLREGPSKDTTSKGVFKPGTVVEGFETNPEGTWIRVHIPTGIDEGFHEGWMALKFLKLLTAAPLTWRLGVNLREFAYYGSGVAGVENTTTELRRQQLETCNALGIKLVRFFASRLQFTAEESIPFIRAALDEIAAFGMQASVCLEDSLTGANQYMAGNDKYHTADGGNLDKEFWRDQAYVEPYLPHILTIVTAFRNDPAILMWELGNELGLYPQPPSPEPGDDEAFLAFVKKASNAIKALAPGHLVSLGLISSHHTYSQASDDDAKRQNWARQLYSLSSVDAVGVHYYRHNFESLGRFVEIDYDIARELGKPFYVGEIGARAGEGDRPEFYTEHIERWKRDGAFTVMPWQLDTSIFDVNICDDCGIGFARDKSQDYDAILEALKAQA